MRLDYIIIVNIIKKNNKKKRKRNKNTPGTAQTTTNPSVAIQPTASLTLTSYGFSPKLPQITSSGEISVYLPAMRYGAWCVSDWAHRCAPSCRRNRMNALFRGGYVSLDGGAASGSAEIVDARTDAVSLPLPLPYHFRTGLLTKHTQICRDVF